MKVYLIKGMSNTAEKTTHLHSQLVSYGSFSEQTACNAPRPVCLCVTHNIWW